MQLEDSNYQMMVVSGLLFGPLPNPSSPIRLNELSNRFIRCFLVHKLLALRPGKGDIVCR